jgi:hypothetical protein
VELIIKKCVPDEYAEKQMTIKNNPFKNIFKVRSYYNLFVSVNEYSIFVVCKLLFRTGPVKVYVFNGTVSIDIQISTGVNAVGQCYLYAP